VVEAGFEEVVERAARLAERGSGADGRVGDSGCGEASLASVLTAVSAVTRSRPSPREQAAAVRAWRGILADRAILKGLLAGRGPSQRTPEWYSARSCLLTASDLHDGLNGGRESFVRRRAVERRKHRAILSGGAAADEDKPECMSAAVRWGVDFEPVALAVYEAREGAEVHAFGLLRHRSLECLGASPDGITSQGVLVEIKCPYSRVPDGRVLPKYATQVQAQLEVCNLRKCDFVECLFREYPSAETYEDDSSPEAPWCTVGGSEKGALMPSGAVLIDSPCDAPTEADGARASLAPRALVEAGARLWRLEAYVRTRIGRDPGFLDLVADRVRELHIRVESLSADEEACRPTPRARGAFAFLPE
jgi:putative phage-type endonuclease